MQIGIFENADEVADVAAKIIIDAMNSAQRKVLGVATGSTPLPLYARLRAAHTEGHFDLSDAHAYALDEYVGIDPDHPERYRNVLSAELVGEDKTGLKDENLHTPDGNNPDPFAAAAEYEADILASGGVELQILGIGADGHIGFNEPGISLASRTHVDGLTAQTRKDNARFFNDDESLVPTKCITQGIGTIMDAKCLVMVATGAAKVDAVRATVEGAISSRWPASIMQLHQNAYVLLDEEAAAGLELGDFYKERWESLYA